MLITGQTRRVNSQPVTVDQATGRVAPEEAAAMLRATRRPDMLKRFGIVALVMAVIVGAVFPVIASAQTAPPPMSSVIVKMVAGLTPTQQADVIARNGGIELSRFPALRLHVIAVPTSDLAATLAAYQADPQVQRAEENKVRQTETAPNDPLYRSQWYLPQVSWDLAFGTVAPTGSSIVAVLDTGVDATHPDLGNNAVAGTSILDGSNGMTDSNGHGTSMAGIVAAQTNTITPEGMAGVAYAGVRIMPVTVLDSTGLGQDSDVIQGVIWAADNGANVILMGFSNPGFSPNLQDAIDYAWSRGVILVAATGNAGAGTATFPAGDRGVVGVSATDSTDGLAGFSNYGQAAFLAAPGTNIQTTDLGGSYSVISGTSASAAIVAGVAGLMKAVDPTLSNGIIVGRMARMADPAGTQEQTGNGRVNMSRALADTSLDPVQPAGADPVGAGGPFVGPYVAAAFSITLTPNSGPAGTSVTVASGGGPFGPPATINGVGIYWDGTVDTTSGTLVASCSNNAGGNLPGPCTFTVPSATSGAHTVVASLKTNPSGHSASATFTVTGPTKLAITSVNGGSNPTFGTPFAVVIQSQDSSSNASNVTAATNVTLSVNTGTGTLGGTVSGTIAAGTTSVTISGVTYSKAENGVVLTATRTSGDTLTAGNSTPFNVLKAASTTTFGAAPTPTYLGGNFTVSASNDSGGAITYSQVSGPCAVVNATAGTFSSSGAGNCVVQADSATTTNYLASSAQQTVVIAKAQPMVTFGAAPTPTYLGGNFTVSASTTNTDSAALTYSAVSGPCALVTGATFSSSGAGTCQVQASGAATANFLTASNTQDVTIAKAASTTTFGAAPTPTYLGGNFTVSASNNSGGTITYSQVSGPCAVVNATAGTFSSSGAGNCVVQADSATTTNYLASSAQQTVTIAKAASTTTFGTAPTPTYLGGNFTVSASNNSGGAITYSQVSGPCAVVNASTGTFSSSGAGSCVVQADSATTTNYLASSAQQTVVIAKAQPTVTFGAAPTPTYLGGNFTVSASTTNTDSAALTYSAVSGPCALVSGATFSSSGAGTCQVQASGAATTNFLAASNTQDVTIAKAASTTTFGAAPTPTYLGGNFTVSASNDSGGAITYSQVSGPCAVVNATAGTFSSSGAGSCVVQADSATTTNYLASSAQQTVTIAKAQPTVTFGAAPTPTYLGGNFTVSASTTNTDSAALTYSAVSGPCALVSGATFSSSGAGICQVQASGAATTNFLAASNTQDVTIAKAASTTTFGAAPTPTYLGGNFTVSASNDSGGAITYSQVSGPCAVVNATAGTFSSSGAGSCVVQADSATTTNYLASSAQQTVTIAKAQPTVTFGAAPTPTYLGGNFTVSASTTNTDSAALTYSAVSGPCALVSGATFSSSGAGICQVQASGAVTANFLTASNTQDVTIAKAASTTTFGAAPTPTYLGGNFTVSASNNSGGAITYSQVSGPCAVVNASTGTFSSSGAGSCVVQADSATTTNYLASSAQQTVTIAKAASTTTLGAAPTPTYLGGNFTVSASNNSGGAITYSQVSGPCAVVNASTGTFSSSGAGSCVVQADSATTTNYLASSAQQTVTIAKADQTITFAPLTNKNPCDPSFAVSATGGGSGNPVTFSIVSGPATISGDAVALTGQAGLVTVRASQAGSTDYNPAPDVDRTFNVLQFGFYGFLPPIGGADGTGGSYADTVRTFKLGSTIPVKFTASCNSASVLTGIHTLQAIKYSNATDSDTPVDASPTDAATTGNQFRLTDGEWHFNLSTKGGAGFSQGTWKLIATLSDGSQHYVWITIKK